MACQPNVEANWADNALGVRTYHVRRSLVRAYCETRPRSQDRTVRVSQRTRLAAACAGGTLPHCPARNCMRRQAQSLLHRLRSAMAPSVTTGLRVQLTCAPRELASDGVRPRVAAARGARLSGARRAGCGARAEAQSGTFPAPHTGSASHVAGGQTLALRVHRPVAARAQSTLAVASEPTAEPASAEAPLESAPPDVRVVDNRADAEDVVRRLMSLEDDGCPVYHAVDTEVLRRCFAAAAPRPHMTRLFTPRRCLTST